MIYKRECDYECDGCRRECSAQYHGPATWLAGEMFCLDCRACCTLGCGEWIDDGTVAHFGPLVHMRDPRDGKIVACHVECAASFLLDCEIEEETTREQIAIAVHRAEGFSGAEAWLLSFVEEMEATPCAS